MQIKWLRKALRNIEQIHDYIAKEKDNPDAAGTLGLKIQQAVKRLADMPHVGREGRVEGTRELVILHTPYIVIYRVKDDAVHVIRVLHSARKYPD